MTESKKITMEDLIEPSFAYDDQEIYVAFKINGRQGVSWVPSKVTCAAGYHALVHTKGRPHFGVPDTEQWYHLRELRITFYQQPAAKDAGPNQEVTV